MNVTAIKRARITVNTIAETLDELQGHADTLAAELRDLEGQLYYKHARVFYRESNKKKGEGQKYAYVAVHPPGGTRERLYVGLLPEKIAAAEDAIRRGVRILELRRDLQRIETETASAGRELDSTARRVFQTLKQPVPLSFLYRHDLER